MQRTVSPSGTARPAAQRGLSIIELAVVMVVIGMLLASAIPSMTEWLRNARLRNQAESLQSGLMLARNEAVRRNRSLTLWLVNTNQAHRMDNTCTLSANGTSWVISARTPAGACGATPTNSSTDASNPLIVATRLGVEGASGVAVAATDAAGSAASSVTFDAFGRASGATTIAVNYASSRSSDRPLRLEISPAGMSRSCDTTITSTSDPRRCGASNIVIDTGTGTGGTHVQPSAP